MSSKKTKSKVLFVVPLPPPWAGVEQISQFLVQSDLVNRFRLKVIKGNIRKKNEQKGRWDGSGMLQVGKVWIILLFNLLVFRPHLVYLTISQNLSGLCRDSAYILLLLLFRVSFIGHFHGSKLRESLACQPRMGRWIFSLLLKKFSKIIVCAKSVKKDLSSIFNPSLLRVVYNGSAEIRKDFSGNPLGQTSEDRFHVSFMGHLSEAKGFYDLIETAPGLMSKYNNLHFVFAGERLDRERNVPEVKGKKWRDASRWREFEELRRRFPHRIHLAGIVTGEQKNIFFRNSQLFVFPSYAESFGIAVFEAMRAGLPVVASEVGALPEILKEGENCLFIQPGDVKGLGQAISELIDHPDRRKLMAKNNRVLSQQYSVNKMASEIGDLFDEILRDSKVGLGV